MASQPVFPAGTPTSDPSGLPMLNAGYSSQTAVAAQRAQDLAQALAVTPYPVQDLRTPNASGNDLLADALMQWKFGTSMQAFAQGAGTPQPWLAPATLSGLDQPSGGRTVGFAPANPAPRADTPQLGEANFDDLITSQDPPSSPGAGAAHLSEAGDGADDRSGSNNVELASNKKNPCIEECYPILERPRSRSLNGNEFDFHKCLNECMKRLYPESYPKQTPPTQPHPHPLPWWMLIPRIAPEIAPELIPFLA